MTSHPRDDADLAELVCALTAGPRPHELDGFAEPLAAYRTAAASRRAVRPHRTPAGRAVMLPRLVTTRATAALGGAALGLVATAVAVALSLPVSPADPSPPTAVAATATSEPAGADGDTDADDGGNGVGPDATGPAAKGLCRAWSRHQANGSTDALQTPPMRNLAEAAGGPTKVATYCATIGHPGQGKDKGDEAEDRAGKDARKAERDERKAERDAQKDARKAEKDARKAERDARKDARPPSSTDPEPAPSPDRTTPAPKPTPTTSPAPEPSPT